MSVAVTIMHFPEATKERVEWTTLDVTATEIPIRLGQRRIFILGAIGYFKNWRPS